MAAARKPDTRAFLLFIGHTSQYAISALVYEHFITSANDIAEKLQAFQKVLLKKANNKNAYDETLIKRRFERIVVWDDHFTVTPKSG